MHQQQPLCFAFVQTGDGSGLEGSPGTGMRGQRGTAPGAASASGGMLPDLSRLAIAGDAGATHSSTGRSQGRTWPRREGGGKAVTGLVGLAMPYWGGSCTGDVHVALTQVNPYLPSPGCARLLVGRTHRARRLHECSLARGVLLVTDGVAAPA